MRELCIIAVLLLCFVLSQAKSPEIYFLHVSSEIDYRFAKTVITNKVVNKEPTASEALFDLTLPNEAFITAFTLIINGKKIEGKVKEKEQAKREFEAAKSKGQSAGHIVVKPRESNKFQIQVNVAATEKVTFELSYRELLKRTNGLYDHVIYINPGQVVDDLKINVSIKETSNITTIKTPPIRNDLLTEGSEDNDVCTSSPCQNNGTCVNNIGSYSCECLEGWMGDVCEIDIDECFVKYPCKNNATCVNNDGSYQCDCVEGWRGKNCQTDIDECEENGPCENNRTCINTQGSYGCVCTVGWQGQHCDKDVNECFEKEPCQNNATCFNNEGSYDCSCSVGWEGKHCEIAAHPMSNAGQKSQVPSFGITLPGLSKPLCFDLPMVSGKIYNLIEMTSPSLGFYFLHGLLGTNMIDRVIVYDDGRLRTINADSTDVSKAPFYQKLLDTTSVVAKKTHLGLQFLATFPETQTTLGVIFDGILAIWKEYSGKVVDIVMESGGFVTYIEITSTSGSQMVLKATTKEFGDAICWYLDNESVKRFYTNMSQFEVNVP